MKKILTLIAAIALTFLGTSVQSEARPHHGYHAPSSTVFVSGYRYGRPVYTEKYFVGYDRRGRPVFHYRTIQPRGGYSSRNPYHCQQAYPPRQSRGYYSSGSRVTFSIGL